MKYYHCSGMELQVGTILKPMGEAQVSKEMDALLDKYRPASIPLPRSQGVFMVDEDDPTGDLYMHQCGENEHVYEVQPLDQVYGPFHTGYVNSIAGDLQQGVPFDDDHIEYIERYWMGDEWGEAGWEYYTKAAKVVRYLGKFDDLAINEEIQDIKRRAGIT